MSREISQQFFSVLLHHDKVGGGNAIANPEEPRGGAGGGKKGPVKTTLTNKGISAPVAQQRVTRRFVESWFPQTNSILTLV